MTDFRAAFQAAFPRAVDFLKTEYEANQEEVDQIASEEGYQLAGIRLAFAVFTTKKTLPVAAQQTRGLTP